MLDLLYIDSMIKINARIVNCPFCAVWKQYQQPVIDRVVMPARPKMHIRPGADLQSGKDLRMHPDIDFLACVAEQMLHYQTVLPRVCLVGILDLKIRLGHFALAIGQRVSAGRVLFVKIRDMRIPCREWRVLSTLRDAGRNTAKQRTAVKDANS